MGSIPTAMNIGVESSNNNVKSPKETDVLRVAENPKKDTYSIEVKKKIVDSAL